RRHRFVRRLETNSSVALPVELLDCRRVSVDERNYHLSVVGRVALVDDDKIPIADLFVYHRVAFDTKHIMVATASNQIIGNADGSACLDRLDGRACGNSSD